MSDKMDIICEGVGSGYNWRIRQDSTKVIIEAYWLGDWRFCARGSLEDILITSRHLGIDWVK